MEALLLISRMALLTPPSFSGTSELTKDVVCALLNLLRVSVENWTDAGHKTYSIQPQSTHEDVSRIVWYCVKRREVEVLQILSILHNHRFELLQNINGMNWGQDIAEICLRLLINSRGPFCTVTTRTALRILSFSLQYLSSSKLLNDSPINVNGGADDAWLPSLLLECLGHLT